ncbi:phage tail tube protein [Methylogaea oryzae]|uniref:Phage tail protein n=1 Tax=Methylogaea oryzae TaxID=1295382 RepID=A0A8D4VNB1_9GAMM|nr:phage tail tube protein [Methylogaea oryzae]BBL69694.1 hypothetical protein MoryE10_03000 [Methylogaea oryzae]
MTASNQVTGRAKVNAGELGELATEKGATFTEGGDKRNEKPADNGRTYFSKETESPALSIKVLSLPGISEKKLRAIEGATVLFEADNGKRWMLVNAFTKTAKLNVADGAYDVEMSCEIVEEM